MQIIRLSDLPEVPWENGRGVTRIVAQHEDAVGPVWRVSIAEMDRDAAFSAFPGLTRMLTVVAGEGIVLHGPDGAETHCGPAKPVTFDGSAPIRASLKGGAVRNFNLMYDADRCTAEARCLRDAGEHAIGAAEQTDLIHVVRGGVRLSKRPEQLSAGDTALLNDPRRFTLLPESVALVLSLRG